MPCRCRPVRTAGRSLALHVEEERGGATALHHPLALLGDLAGLLAVLAADGERQGAQPALRDLFTALEAVPEGAFLQPAEGLLDLRERFGLHLDEGELDVILNVRLGRLSRVEDAVGRAVGTLSTDVADLLVHGAHDLAAAFLEDVLELRIPIPIHLTSWRIIDAHMIPLLLSAGPA